MKLNYLRSLLLSPENKLLITAEAFHAVMMECFPPSLSSQVKPQSFWDQIPSYKDITQSAVQELVQELKKTSETSGISISADFHSEEIEDGTIAYHSIRGMILAEAYYWFSSKQLEKDLLAAESNPGFACHFLHINSGGGEAWYLDRLSETLRGCSKPIYVLFEKAGCSAAYYIGCHGNTVRCLTQNDNIGSIGTMVSFYDFEGYFEKLGIKKVEAYATKSTLKNKKYKDLKEGNPEQYIQEELDPLTEQFIQTVQSARPNLTKLPEDDPVFQGESFSAITAQEKGLIDGITTLPVAILEAYTLGQEWLSAQTIHNKLTQYLH